MTPNIDRLAKEGVRLTQHIAAAPLCTPSRAAFLTGRYPIRSGMASFGKVGVYITSAASGRLPSEEVTFAKVAKQQGYQTALIGKWHLGLNCERSDDYCHHPSAHGFDHFYGITLTNLRDCQRGHGSVFFNVLAHLPLKTLGVGVATVTLLHARGVVTVRRRLALSLAASVGAAAAVFGLFIVTFPFFNCFLMRNREVVEQPYVSENLTQRMTDEAVEFLAKCVLSFYFVLRRNGRQPFVNTSENCLIVSDCLSEMGLNLTTALFTSLRRCRNCTVTVIQCIESTTQDTCTHVGSHCCLLLPSLSSIQAVHLLTPVMISTVSDRNSARPFLMFFSFIQVHTAMFASPAFQGTSQHGVFGDAVHEVDWSVGQLMRALDRLNLRENTLVYLTSDQGAHLEEISIRGEVHRGSNGIYKAGKSTNWEGGIRVPGLLRWTGTLPEGKVTDEPISNMDVFPTVVKLTGGMVPVDRVIDGHDLMPLLQGEVERSEHEFLFHYCNAYLNAVRWHPPNSNLTWKAFFFTPNFYPENGTACMHTHTCFCTGSYVTHHDPPLLFELSRDPSETRPLTPDAEPAFHTVLEQIRAASARHVESIIPVQDQLALTHVLWKPWLQPCCSAWSQLCRCERDSQRSPAGSPHD
ncbi:steryl-sulfatase isoform X2 [Esox lucius]|uniref:steryl-sulfatase isoform X2 n=1 Tax=Esox lucius TaxID=8010 RepID=UPI0014776D46|nr:steryl-sulfatase isoform X2 [Esox lucius]